MMSSSSTSRHPLRSSSLRSRHIAAALVVCMLLSALRPLPTLAQAPLDDQAVGGVELELAWQMGGAITALDVQGDYAYLGIGPRLVVLDVSDPTDPFLVGQTEVLPSAETGEPQPYAQICAISVVTDTAYLAIVSADDNLSLLFVDVSKPPSPKPGAGVIPIVHYPRPAPWSVELCWLDDQLVIGCTADDYYAWGGDEIILSLVEMIDGLPRWRGRFGPRWGPGSEGSLYDISSHNGRLRVLYFGNTQCTWDSYLAPLVASDDPSGAEPVSTPSASRHLWPLCESLYPDAWTLCSETAAFIASRDRMYAVEPAPTVEPTAYPSCALSDTAARDACLTQDGHFAAVVSESETLIVDLREPLEPTVVGRAALGSQYVDVAGDHAYVAGGGELHVVDISDPSQPQAMGAWRQPEWTAVSHLEVLSPDRLLVSVGSQLLALDTPADAEPTIAGGLDVGAPINYFCTVEDAYYDLMLATNGLGLIPVSLDDEGLPVLAYDWPLESCDANYVGVVQTSWEEDYFGSPYTERRILALTDDRSLAMDVGTYRRQCPEHLVSVCEGFSLEQVVGRYAYVGRTLYGREGRPESGQIEVYDLSDWRHAPRLASVITTEHPVDSIVPHDACLYVGGVGTWGATGPGSTLLRVFGVSDPVTPERLHATVYGDCDVAEVVCVSEDYLVANTNYVGGCWGTGGGPILSGIAVMRLNEGPELQLVGQKPYDFGYYCPRAEAFALSGDLIYTAHPVYGLVAWCIRPLPPGRSSRRENAAVQSSGTMVRFPLRHRAWAQIGTPRTARS